MSAAQQRIVKIATLRITYRFTSIHSSVGSVSSFSLETGHSIPGHKQRTLLYLEKVPPTARGINNNNRSKDHEKLPTSSRYL